MPTLVVPRLRVTLPSGWRDVSRPGGPRTWLHAGRSAVLQAMAPREPADVDVAQASATTEPADDSPGSHSGRLRDRLRSLPGPWQDGVGALTIDEGTGAPSTIPFGHAARAHWHGPEGQILSLWLLMAPQLETVLFTWLVTGDDALDAEAAAIVLSAVLAPPVPPLLLSVALGAARFSLDTTGSLLSSVLLLTTQGGLRKTLPIAVENGAQLAIFAQHVRNELAASRADAVAVLAEAEGQGAAGEPQRFLSIYLETAQAAQRFLLPLTVQASDTGGQLLMGEPFEVSVGEDPLSALFAPAM